MNPAAIREAQAVACLAAAERYKPQLLALGEALAGSRDGGNELFQQAALYCHDTIQTGGFEGEHFQFYLRKAIKNLHYRTVKQQQRTKPVDFRPLPIGIEEDERDEFQVPSTAQRVAVALEALHASGPAAPVDAQGLLAGQIMAEIRLKFKMADRVALRLHVDGMSCQKIAELIGTRDQSWVWRRIRKMKRQLREAFRQQWEALGE